MIKINRPKKHSLTLKGHRTSVSLEDPFWYQFKKISAEKGIALNVLAAEIDDARGIGYRISIGNQAIYSRSYNLKEVIKT